MPNGTINIPTKGNDAVTSVEEIEERLAGIHDCLKIALANGGDKREAVDNNIMYEGDHIAVTYDYSVNDNVSAAEELVFSFFTMEKSVKVV